MARPRARRGRSRRARRQPGSTLKPFVYALGLIHGHRATEALADVAPYLVRFRKDSGLLSRLVEEGWGRSWGVFFTSSQSMKNVRRHFRRFLLVEEDETFARMVQFARRHDATISQSEAERRTFQFMSERPAWKDHPSVVAGVRDRVD